MTRLSKTITGLAASVAFSAFALPALAADPLVDVDWVLENIGAEGVVFVDARAQADYLRGHIPGAVHTNYAKAGWRVKEGEVRGLFPADPAKLAEHIGSLGIGNDTHVVLVAPGASSSDMGTATRMYWTFNVLGHEEVSILNGGMAAYLKEVDDEKNPVNPLEKGPVEVTAASFAVDLQEDMLLDAEEVAAAAAAGTVLVDNRTADQFIGVNKSGAAKTNGTIPGAVSLPQIWMTENGGGMFRDAETLAKLYEAAGVPTEGDQISFCNTGHWASIGWFASHEILGNEDAQIYDGSMAAWTHADMPMEVKLSTN